MRTAKVMMTERLSHRHNESPGSGKYIRVITDLPKGEMNTFYIDVTDSNKVPLKVISDDPKGLALDPDTMKEGDEVCYDKQNFLQKVVIWKGRRFRQRGYSFDFYGSVYAPSLK